ncbi:MAG TPA: hypothetical protein VM198_11950 [Longimicrobiales bacterium]|jgi:hypothetical protein|nr:hypothetical protein [Longimicrobiales bacterium]
MRAFGTVALAGISGVILWQLFTTILLPLLGVVLGLLAMAAKFALIAAVGFFVYSLIKKRREQAEA